MSGGDTGRARAAATQLAEGAVDAVDRGLQLALRVGLLEKTIALPGGGLESSGGGNRVGIPALCRPGEIDPGILVRKRMS